MGSDGRTIKGPRQCKWVKRAYVEELLLDQNELARSIGARGYKWASAAEIKAVRRVYREVRARARTLRSEKWGTLTVVRAAEAAALLGHALPEKWAEDPVFEVCEVQGWADRDDYCRARGWRTLAQKRAERRAAEKRAAHRRCACPYCRAPRA